MDRARRGLLLVALLGAGLVGLLTSTADEGAPPRPKQPIPVVPSALARTLTANALALRAAVDRWRRDGNPGIGSPPEEVTLRALYHQRIAIVLSARHRLARATIRRLHGRVRADTRDLVAAGRDLLRLAPPQRRRRWRTGAALPAGRLLRYYRLGERRFRVSRRVLAAVNLVETDFNRLRNRSLAGARGPMQFLPSTWRTYGLGGDIDDPHDAILGAANYLHRSGAPRNYRRALYSYNGSRLYVDAVLRYARSMRRDFRNYYVLYGWQVFVRTPSGLRRLTGSLPR